MIVYLFIYKPKQNDMRDFYSEINDDKFKPITYGLYNKIYDDSFVEYLNNQHKTVYSKDDFEYMTFDLTDKEKFLLKMRNKEYNLNIIILKQKLSKNDKIKVYVENDNGRIIVIRLIEN